VAAIQESILHWERMIAWALTRPANKIPSATDMEKGLGEAWFVSDCELCRKHYDHTVPYGDTNARCPSCPLAAKYGICGVGGAHATNHWVRVDMACTWRDWIIQANLMLEQLRSLESGDSHGRA